MNYFENSFSYPGISNPNTMEDNEKGTESPSVCVFVQKYFEKCANTSRVPHLTYLKHTDPSQETFL